MEVVPPQNPVTTPNEWEKLVKNEFNQHRKMLRRYRQKEDGISLFDFTDNMVKRRQKAIVNTMPEIYRKYTAPDTVQPILAQIWTDINMPFTSYAQLDAHSHILFAASMWILDQVSCQENWRELYRYLPENDDIIDDLCLHDAWDSEYDYDLIYSVEYVLHHRNPVEMDVQEKPRTLTSEYLAKGAIDKDTQDRKNYEGLISLIPQESIDQAVEKFREHFWQWVDRFYEAAAPHIEASAIFDAKIREQQIEYNNTVEKLNAVIDKWFDSSKKKPQSPFALNRVPDVMPFFGTQAAGPINLSPHNPEALKDDMLKLGLQMEGLFEGADELIHKANTAYSEFRSFSKHIARIGRATRNDAANYENISIEPMEPMRIENPYEMCFALLYLIESGDDLPWLYGAGCGLVGEVAETLPWGIIEYDEFEDDVWCVGEEDGEEVICENQEVELPKSIVIPDYYERSYRMKGEDFDFPRNLAQIIYEETGCILPRDLHMYDSKARLMSKYGIRGKDAAAILVLMSTLESARRSMKALNFDGKAAWLLDEDESSEEQQPKAPQKPKEEDAEALKSEIKRLKAALHAADLENRETKKTLASIKAAANIEHRELADLREFVFNQDTEEMTEETVEDDKWPYEVHKDTVVFGGHATWAKGIKSILNGSIRFIDKDLVFDTELVKHAAVIWIQPNAISHPMYWRVVDTARAHKKPVRYFAFASWVKCAEQVMENDA